MNTSSFKSLKFLSESIDGSIKNTIVKILLSPELRVCSIKQKHSDLIKEHQKLKHQLKIIKDKNSKHKLDQLKFNEKIDELNQETDILLDEIDKWQT